MQLIAVASIFAAVACALPQFGPGPFPPNRFVPGRQPIINGSPLPNPFRQDFPCADGDQNGCYRTSCYCTKNGQYDDFATQLMIQDLHSRYDNLVDGGGQIVDLNGRGVERNGVSDSCRRVSQNPFFVQRFGIQRFGNLMGQFYLPNFPDIYFLDANCVL